MRSKYPGECTSCESPWSAGDEIVKLLGKWVHPACKTAHLNSMDTTRTTLRPDRAWTKAGEIRPGVGHTRGIRKVT